MTMKILREKARVAKCGWKNETFGLCRVLTKLRISSGTIPVFLTHRKVTGRVAALEAQDKAVTWAGTI